MSKKSHITSGVRKILELPSIYDLFQNLIGGNQHRKEHFEKYIISKNPNKVLDIGCGTCVLLEHLDENVDYIGCDMQKEYIEHAKLKYENRGEFYCEKVGENIREDWLDSFDVINAHGLLHHLDDQESRDLLEISFKYLKPGGVLVTVDTTYHKNQGKITKYIVSKDRGQNIRTPQEYLELGNRFFNKVEGVLDDNAFNIPYSIYTMVLTK